MNFPTVPTHLVELAVNLPVCGMMDVELSTVTKCIMVITEGLGPPLLSYLVCSLLIAVEWQPIASILPILELFGPMLWQVAFTLLALIALLTQVMATAPAAYGLEIVDPWVEVILLFLFHDP